MLGLKIHRKKKKMSRRELADKLGVTATTIYLWETGRRQPKDDKTLIRLAELLDCLVDDLIR
ncbi:MAG TPA: helix-turn-helix transcriptional regulator [Clostridia bacterium]